MYWDPDVYTRTTSLEASQPAATTLSMLNESTASAPLDYEWNWKGFTLFRIMAQHRDDVRTLIVVPMKENEQTDSKLDECKWKNMLLIVAF